MRIGIDCRFVLNKPTGIGSYTIGLVRDLLQIDHKNRYVLFVKDELPQQLQAFVNGNAEVQWIPLPPMGLKQKIHAATFINPHNLDVYHYPHHDLPYGLQPKSVVTVHHLIELKINTGPGYLKRALLLAGMLRSIKRADKIIADSRYTATKIRERLGNSIEINAIYPPKSMAMAACKPDDKLPFDLVPQQFFLSVAEWRPHKNLSKLVRAFKMAQKSLPVGWKLVLVGSRYKNYDAPEKEVARLQLKNDVILVERISAIQLQNLYRNTKSLVFISKLEGFGYPLVEAFLNETPVICSRAGSLPEIAANAALYVNHEDEAEISAAMIRISQDDDLIHRLRIQAKKQISQFVGYQSARRILQTYQSLVAEN